MNDGGFLHSTVAIAKRDLFEHFQSLSNNLLLFFYFITGAVFWAATLGGLVSIASYFEFLLVGLLVQGIYNTSYNYVNVLSGEVRRGYVKYLLALPLDRGGLTIGRIIAGAMQGVIYVTILLLFAMVMIGPPPLAGLPTILGTMALLSVCLSSLGLAVATHFKPDNVEAISDLLGLGLLFTSTLYYPPKLMPVAIRVLSTFNVISAGANLMRSGYGLGLFNLQDLIVLCAWSLLFLALGARGYYRQLEALN